MSDTVTLRLRAPLERRIEADAICPDRFASASTSDIARLTLWDGAHRIALGDVFDVDGERAASVRLGGDLSMLDALGAGMTQGELFIDGTVGRYVGTRMRGGVVRVTGSVGEGAGLEMAGGLLDIAGNAGDRLGAGRRAAARGMVGGEIIVRGRAGSDVGASMRRGTIVVAGRVGARAGANMIAGNVIALGDVGDDPGRFNKRGTIAVYGRVDVPPTYRLVCTYSPPHLAVLLTHLERHRAIRVDPAWRTGVYRRHSGDMAELGRGEILEWRGRQ